MTDSFDKPKYPSTVLKDLTSLEEKKLLDALRFYVPEIEEVSGVRAVFEFVVVTLIVLGLVISIAYLVFCLKERSFPCP